jgi:type I restriction enzyme S subunit
LVAHAEGSAYPAVNPKFISSYELTDFCAVERQRIGDILRPFDDKIDCNSCLSTTLEEMSQALFKSWFVDFDPVVAKSAGRKPFGMSDDIAALFPDSFEESELGAVPKGWRVFGIGEISHNYDSKRIPLSASQRAIRQGSFPYYGAAGQIDLVDDYIFDGDFVLVGEDGSVVTPQGTPMLQFVTGKFWVNNHAHVLQGKGLITNELLYLCLHDQQIDGLVTGAVQPKLTQANLNSIKVPLPTEDNLMKAFTDIVRVFFDKIKLSREENSTLTSSRQILLTRLLSEGADFRIEGVRSTEATAA